jgi:hypothetical protein
VNPKYLDFFHAIKRMFVFDNSKSEEFEVFPLRVWNMADYSYAARRLTQQDEQPMKTDKAQ